MKNFYQQFTAIAKSLTISNLGKEMINYKKSFAFIGLLTSSALTLTANPAQAFNFTDGSNLGTCSTLTTGSTLPNCETTEGFKLKALPNGKVLDAKTVNGVTGVGVSLQANNPSKDQKDAVSGEIDFGEFLELTLPNQGILADLGLSFLYQPGVFGDMIFEAAVVDADGPLKGILTVTGDNTATWSFLGATVNNISPSTSDGGGYYNIINPFGDNKVTSLKLRTKSNNPDDYKYSDFALVNASVKAVPEPTTLVGLGLLGGLFMTNRRRKVSQVR